MKAPRRISLKDLNSSLVCNLCGGYYIDATTLIDCMHAFCRGCILRHFENKLACPTCNTIYKKKNHSCLRQDLQLQTLVYKMVPGLYAKEMQRREDFYRSTGVRASSSCSDDSVLGDMMHDHEEWVHTNLGEDNQFLSPDDSISLSLEYYQYHLDETSPSPPKGYGGGVGGDCSTTTSTKVSASETSSANDSAISESGGEVAAKSNGQIAAGGSSASSSFAASSSDLAVKKESEGEVGDDKDVTVVAATATAKAGDGLEKATVAAAADGEGASVAKDEKVRRYLQCPAAVSMSHLQKFLRMKYALSAEHKVDIVYRGEVLPPYFSLIDVAYTFKWQRAKPMRFFYRIFTPLKIRPIKIINTSSTGQKKQLQIVPVTPTSEHNNNNNNNNNKVNATETKTVAAHEGGGDLKTPLESLESDAQNQRNKERLMAELQLQSKAKATEIEEQKAQQQVNSRYGKTYENQGGVGKGDKRKHIQPTENSVYDYEEQEREEMKRFAEKRDREWQMQKHPDSEEPRVSKKRKKSKHSKSDSLHKKRKLHAEITSELSSKEESIKLKVKLMPHNGHKHKHHKSQTAERQMMDVVSSSSSSSSKEKLLQMRQIRHKNIGVEETRSKHQNSVEQQQQGGEVKGEFTITIAKNPDKSGETRVKTSTKTSETQTKTNETQTKTSETQTKSSETQTIISRGKAQLVRTNESKTQTVAGTTATTTTGSKMAEVKVEKTVESSSPVISGKTLRSDFSIKTNASKDLCTKLTTSVQIERNELMERHAQKTFLKNFPAYADKHGDFTKKIPTVRVENLGKKLTDQPKASSQLSRLQQQYAAIKAKETKQQEAAITTTTTTTTTTATITTTTTINNKKVSFAGDKPHILNTQYHPGFTVSKIETGVKRKAEVEENVQDKRPSLEITLINPPGNVTAPPKQSPTPAKRPPPPTIPLDRIKKSITLKSGISIIPKMAEKCDNIGALDLSKPHKSTDAVTKPNGLVASSSAGNGLKQMASAPGRILPPDKNVQLSNLQMLSKVASEHPNLNKPLHLQQQQGKSRPQMPSLQTLKIPHPNPNLNSHLNALTGSNQQQGGQPKSSNLAKLPKLNEINKSQFRMVNTQLRNMRPNQNQSIRNIPNPSLLVRQQNQNRLNSLSSSSSSSSSNSITANTSPVQKTTAEAPPSGKSADKSGKSESDVGGRNQPNKTGSAEVASSSKTD